MLNSRLYQTVFVSIASGATVGLSTAGQGWVLSHFARSSLNSANLVKGGDTLRLQHAQHEGYISVFRADRELRQEESPLTEVLEKVVGDQVFVEATPSGAAPSCRSLLLVELQSTRQGDALKENEPCRLKSEAGGKYLYVDPKDEQLRMLERPEMEADLKRWHRSTLFSLMHVKRISDQDDVPYGSYIY
eukprot:419812-Prymnesium_polylepis.1